MSDSQAPQIDRVKDLQDYLGASAGRRIMKDPSRGVYSVDAWYSVFTSKMGKVAQNDPGMLGLVQDARTGYANGGTLSNPHVLKSLNYYADIFNATYEEATVGELLKFYEGTGKLKPKTTALLAHSADKKVEEIEEAGIKALAQTVFEILREFVEESFVNKIFGRRVDGELGGLEKQLEEMEARA